MRGIENDGESGSPHDRKRAHVDHEVVVPKRRTPLCEKHLLIPGHDHLFRREPHIGRSEELSFFDVDDLSGPSRSLQKLGLTAEKCRNLQDIHNLGSLDGIFGRMNIRQYRDTKLFPHLGKYVKRFIIAYRHKGTSTCPIRLLIGRFEDEGNPAPFCDTDDLSGRCQNHLSALNNAGARDQDERTISTDSYVTNLDYQKILFKIVRRLRCD
jgi:hypothetical protein